MSTPDLRREPDPEHATDTPAARVTGPAAKQPTPAPHPCGGRTWPGNGWRCDRCGTWWPNTVPPIQDPTDVAWRGGNARRFCGHDCLDYYTETQGTTP